MNAAFWTLIQEHNSMKYEFKYKTFCDEIAFENVIWKMMVILFMS